MAYSNIDQQQLGEFLQVAFSEGVRSQISEDYRDWEMIQQVRDGEPNGREIRFLFQSSFGPAAVQYRNPNFTAEFPSSQQISISEHTAVYKELDVTVEIEYNLWNRAMKSPAKYAEPLALEIQSKTVAAKRRLAADWYGDGTGVIMQAGAAANLGAPASEIVISLDAASDARGHIGFVEFGDLLLAYDEAGAANVPAVSSGTFYAYRVKSKSRSRTLGDASSVVLEAVDASGAVLQLAAASPVVAADDVFYRVGQPTKGLNLASVVDYGTASEVIAGLESLLANDGRSIHGITMSGSNAGSALDAGGAALDSSLIQSLMSQVKVNVGEGKYSWKKLCMAPEAQDSLIEARETDRRFHTVEDNKRGVRFWAYQHGNDSLETYTSEFCPKKRLYVLPEQKSGQKVFEFHGTDFEAVKVNDSGEFHLKPGASGGHERRIVTYMEAMGVIIAKHPAACGVLKNFG